VQYATLYIRSSKPLLGLGIYSSKPRGGLGNNNGIAVTVLEGKGEQYPEFLYLYEGPGQKYEDYRAHTL
jgi:hypothetical protein